jgi:poly(A) polymerase
VRMLRAVRFAAKLGFRLHPDTETPISGLAHLLGEIPPARLFDELLKLFHGGCALQTYELLRHLRLFGQLFPDTEECLAEESEGYPRILVARALKNTDERIQAGKPVTPAFLFAALLWEPMRRRAEAYRAEGHGDVSALGLAGGEVMREQSRRISLPRRFGTVTQEIWSLQPRFAQLTGRRPFRLFEHPRFRAAYDFMVLRSEAGEDLAERCEWWMRFQEPDESQRASMVQPARRGSRRRRSRRRAPG